MSSERLWAWVHDEEEDAAQRAEIAAHVEGCAECRAQIAEMRAIVGDLSAIAREDSAPPRPLPESIAGYRILGKLGQGGMGIVYDAEQREPRRPVALKVILGGQHVSELQIKLFHREVQTLARLNHPTIAAIYEAGRTEDGHHFFAMERVEGRTLLDYLEQDRAGALGLRDRLRLFQRICDGMSYAHQRGVIHRDLKPTNILVDENGNPKILDFGLARIVEDEGGDAFTINTESGRILGTLPYMSPEQATGKPDLIDVRSEVYSLGVILYQMLTGRMPYDLRGAGVLRAVQVICERAAVPPRRVERTIPDEVETIVLKALEKDAERRFQSAAALQEDIDRYLKGYPITARPPSSVYQLRKLVARHKIPAALSALLAVSVIAGGVVAAVQARKIAAEVRKKTRIIAEFESLYEAADPWKTGRRDITVLETLNTKSREFETELADDPLVAAAVRNTIGNTYKSFSEFDEAEQHLSFALDQREAHLGEDDLETAESLNDLGELRYLQERSDDAEALWRRALAVRRRRAGDSEISESLNNLGVLQRKRGRIDEARGLLEEALMLRRRHLAGIDTSPSTGARARKQARNDVAQTLNNLGGLYRADGPQQDLGQAERCYRESLRIRLDVFGPSHPEVAKMYNNLGKLLQAKGAVSEAIDAFEASLRIMRQDSGLGRDHQYIARALQSLSEAYFAVGRADDARRAGDEALRIRTEKLGPDHPETNDSKKWLRRIRLQTGG